MNRFLEVKVVTDHLNNRDGREESVTLFHIMREMLVTTAVTFARASGSLLATSVWSLAYTSDMNSGNALFKLHQPMRAG